MKSPLRTILIIQIKGLTGFAFEDFIKELLLLLHGSKDFIPTRPVKDKGCDGILVKDKAVVCCYGPNKYDKDDFDKKIGDDFKSYKKYWQKEYPNWMVIVNHEVSPDQIKKVNALKNKSPLLGIDQIIAIIENDLAIYQIRKLAKYLKIDKEFLTQDYLGEILDDLLKSSNNSDRQVPYTKAPYIVEKITVNYAKEDVQTAINEYEEVVDCFNYIASLMVGYEDDDIRKLKVRIITDFDSATGNFKEKLKQLTGKYIAKYANENDDDYLFYIRAVLVYLFEQCLIGKKAGSER